MKMKVVVVGAVVMVVVSAIVAVVSVKVAMLAVAVSTEIVAVRNKNGSNAGLIESRIGKNCHGHDTWYQFKMEMSSVQS